MSNWSWRLRGGGAKRNTSTTAVWLSRCALRARRRGIRGATVLLVGGEPSRQVGDRRDLWGPVHDRAPSSRAPAEAGKENDTEQPCGLSGAALLGTPWCSSALHVAAAAVWKEGMVHIQLGETARGIQSWCVRAFIVQSTPVLLDVSRLGYLFLVAWSRHEECATRQPGLTHPQWPIPYLPPRRTSRSVWC